MRKSARGKNPIFPPPCHWGFVGGSHPVTGASALPLPVYGDRPQATGASLTAFTSPCCGTKGQPTSPRPRTAQGPTGPRAGGGARAPLSAPGSVGRGVRRDGLARSPALSPARFYRPRHRHRHRPVPTAASTPAPLPRRPRTCPASAAPAAPPPALVGGGPAPSCLAPPLPPPIGHAARLSRRMQMTRSPRRSHWLQSRLGPAKGPAPRGAAPSP